ncbi:universal stress protein [Mucilaginibacter xinganensis]|uniref:Universal stress protein n=1 Tax=Mucilaginibacter xinganensis TaxID=1234841 RepID=A0A223NYK1_9SPHI|nr:universal stress protein [Mucilaginibacter xinganensis]ASU34774.1 Universal stress protein [Mucilaginibacter xinganensis]
MKTILVPTDFSTNASYAATTALILSEKLHANLLLYNTYIDYPNIDSYAGGSWIVEEFVKKQNHSKDNLALLVENLEALSENLDPEDKKPTINWQSGDNDLWLGIAEITHQKSIEMIVMGSRSNKPDDFLLGHDTNSVIEHATCPVLIVPSKTNPKEIDKVTFATDFNDVDIKAMDYLVKLAKLFNYKIEIAHVVEPGIKDAEETEKQMHFVQHVARSRYTAISYIEVRGKDVASRLNHLCKQNQTGLLAMVHNKRSFFGRLFTHSETRKELADQKIPLLVFPA